MKVNVTRTLHTDAPTDGASYYPILLAVSRGGKRKLLMSVDRDADKLRPKGRAANANSFNRLPKERER